MWANFGNGVDFVPTGLDHGIIDIVDDHLPGGAGAPPGQDGQIAGATAHIQYLIPRPNPQHAHGGAFPDMLDAEAEQGIHEIVMGGHAVEVNADRIGLFLFLELADTEPRLAG